MLVSAFLYFDATDQINTIELKNVLTPFFSSNFTFRMAPEVLQPGTGYNFKYVRLLIVHIYIHIPFW
jgi:hypothetical protein